METYWWSTSLWCSSLDSMESNEFNGSCLVTFPWCSLWAEHSHWLRGRQRRKREPTRDILWNMPSPEKWIQGWQKPHSRCYLKTGSRHHHSPHWMDNNSLQSVKRRDSGSPGPEDKDWNKLHNPSFLNIQKKVPLYHYHRQDKWCRRDGEEGERGKKGKMGNLQRFVIDLSSTKKCGGSQSLKRHDQTWNVLI